MDADLLFIIYDSDCDLIASFALWMMGLAYQSVFISPNAIALGDLCKYHSLIHPVVISECRYLKMLDRWSATSERSGPNLMVSYWPDANAPL